MIFSFKKSLFICLITWSAFFFKYLDFGRHFDTEVPTVNWMWLNSLEHWSWIGSGHMCQRVVSQVILPPGPALTSFRLAAATTSGSLCKSHAFLLTSECHQFPGWLSSLHEICSCHYWVPTACHALPGHFVYIYSPIPRQVCGKDDYDPYFQVRKLCSCRVEWISVPGVKCLED